MSHAPTLVTRRKLIALFVPLAILVGAAALTNFGGVAKPANAAAVTVSSTVAGVAWADSNGCSSSMPLTLDDGVFSDLETGACTITFGSATNTSNLFLQGSAGFWQQGSNFYTDVATSCNGPLAAQRIGYKVDTGGTAGVSGAGCAAEAATTNGATSEWRAVDRAAPVQTCTSPTIGQKTCPIVFGAMGPAAGSIAAATYTGTLTPTAS